MAFSAPSIAQFKAQFTRDFPYGTNAQTCVLDTDIASAFMLTNVVFNPGLFPDAGSQQLGYLLLSAHYLVLNLRASSQGLSGQYSWIQTSKSVGSVSESFEIPERIKGNATLLMFTKTHYGALYLQMILPALTGNVLSVYGGTQPV